MQRFVSLLQNQIDNCVLHARVNLPICRIFFENFHLFSLFFVKVFEATFHEAFVNHLYMSYLKFSASRAYSY